MFIYTAYYALITRIILLWETKEGSKQAREQGREEGTGCCVCAL